MHENWYAIRSKPRKEFSIWKQLLADGLITYFPVLKVNPVNPRSRKFVPYFPGYLFVKCDLDTKGISYFKWMPNTLGLVNFDGDPAAVSEHLIHSIKKRLDAINAAGGEELEGLKSGDRVRIREGPFRGYEAVFDKKLPGNERVRVLLELISNERQVPLEIDTKFIEQK